jgi:hypothetical protein
MIVECHQQIAGLLQPPPRVRLAGEREMLDAAAANREEDEHVRPA